MSAVDCYIKKIIELLEECEDFSLLELIYKILLTETEGLK